MNNLNKQFSIYNFYLKTGRVPHGYNRMNSFVKESTSTGDEQEKIITYTFDFTVPGTEVKLQRKLAVLENLKHQDTIVWVNDLRQTKELCDWSEDTTVKIVKSLVSKDIAESIKSLRSLDSILDHILTLQYPSHMTHLLLEQLREVKQNHYFFIKDYLNQIESLIQKISFSKKWKLEMQEERRNEFFVEGLEIQTRLEMSKLNIFNTADIVRHIERVETEIRSLMKKSGDTINSDASTYADKNIQKSQLKYCTVHRTAKHSNTECYKQNPALANKKNFKNTEKEKPKENYLIKENNQYLSILKFSGFIYNIHVNIIVDTGSEINVICSNLFNRLSKNNNTIKATKINDKVQYGNKQIEEVNLETSLELNFQGLPDVFFTEKFKVVQNLDTETIILGIPFLQRQNVQINFEDYYLKIGYNFLPMEFTKLTHLSNPDKEIVKKVMLHHTPEEKINQLILNYKFNNPSLGKMKYENKSRIKLTTNEIIFAKPYPIPYKLMDAVKQEIKRLKELDVIQESTSAYSSPAFPILKKNGNIRLVVDYRKLNKITIKDSFPFPSVQDQLRTLLNAKCFSQIDLNSGYYQIPLHADDYQYTSFVLPFGQYEFKRLPFGLANAPRIFQRIMNKIFEDLNFVKIFLDDILIYSNSIEEHSLHLETILNRCKLNDISINFEKSNFLKKEVNYLGNIVSSEGIKPDTSNLKEIHLEVPKTLKQLQRIIGIINWFRPYIKNLSEKMKSITDKTKKGKFKWTDQDSETIKTIYEEIKQGFKLSYPDFTKDFIIESDASDYGIGAVLLQENKIIGIFSAKLNSAQRNYTVSEKELLAIIEALRHFKPIIYNSKITVRTDHANTLFNTNAENSRIQRWKLLLEEFNIDLKHIKGTENNIADHLSRINTLNLANSTVKSQNIDNVIKEAHLKLSHPGETTLYYTLNKYYKDKDLKKKISNLVKNCEICLKCKKRNKGYGEIKGTLVTNELWKHISSDIYGPITEEENFKRGGTGKTYLITFTDRCSRWTRILEIKDISAETVINAFEKIWFKSYPKPESILTDQGRQYTSSIFQKYLMKHSIRHIKTTSYNPTGNSISERLNQIIGRTFRCNPTLPVKEIIKMAEFSLQSAYNRVLGASPEEIVLGKSSFDPNPHSLKLDLPKLNERQTKILQKQQSAMNSKRKNHIYKPGDLVMKKIEVRGKFDPFYEGPLQIDKILNENVYILKNENKKITANLKQIFPI